jgi:hypothetical protein
MGELEQRRRQYATRYGMTLAEYEDLFVKQAEVCGICHKPPDNEKWRRLGVDHDHVTGAVRGLLCGNCNRGLGMFMDDPDLLRGAIDWLARGGTMGLRAERAEAS